MTEEIRADGLRRQAEAIEALSALVEGARQQAPNLKELLEAALSGDPNATPDMLARSGPVAVSGQDFLFLLNTALASSGVRPYFGVFGALWA